MKKHMNRERWLRIGFIAGIVLFLLGSIDPLEGSGLIALGGIMLAVVARRLEDPHWKYYRLAAILLVVGVALLWIFSALGGFGGEATLAWGWAWLLLPYPVGWFMVLVLFYVRLFGSRKGQ